MNRINKLKQIFSIMLCLSILCGTVAPAFAQTRRRAGGHTPGKTPNKPETAKVTVEKSKEVCNGNWSGTVTYTKTLDDVGSSDEPGIRKGKDRIIQQWSHNVNYEGKMIIDGRGERPVAKVNIDYSDYRKQHGIEKVWDSCHAYNDDHWFIIDGRDDATETASGSGDAKSFNLSFNYVAGTYNFSFTFPRVKGKFNREEHTKRSGHCQPKNNEPYDRSINQETTTGEEGYSIDNQKIDPKNPDVLTGSVTVDRNDYNNPKAVKTFIYTIEWKFRRCSPPIIIKDVKFYQPVYPSPNNWVRIKEGDHTVDGNQVKIVATIANLSGEAKTTYMNLKELKENADLPDNNIQLNFEPYQEREIEYIWDTSGYAWKESNIWNQPEIHRQIQVQVPSDSMVKDIQVNPKPVMIVPGLFSEKEAFGKFMGYFQNTANTEWKTDFAKLFISKASTENVPILEKGIRDLQKKENAWHIDMVAHSTGGLVGRSYIHSQMPTQFDGKPSVTHFVMIGTPNMGSPCAWGTDKILVRIFSRPADSMREITAENMREFNKNITDRKGTKFSILVGNAYAPTCQLDAPGDGITPNLSAIWTIRDWKFSTSHARHENMLGEQSNFMAVTKWLAIGPKGNHKPDTSALLESPLNINENQTDGIYFGKSRRYGAMYHPAKFEGNSAPEKDISDDPNEKNILETGIKLQPNQTTEIDVPVIDSSRMAIVIYAPAGVSATLTDTSGSIVGKNLAGTPEAEGTFRTITVNKPIRTGTWKLKLENRDAKEAEIAVTAFANTNPLALAVSAGNPTAANQVLLQAKLTNNGAPVANAKVTAKINNATEITFFDDGKHGDAAANDGVYGATTEKLAEGDYMAETKAETNNVTLQSSIAFSIGAAKTGNKK